MKANCKGSFLPVVLNTQSSRHDFIYDWIKCQFNVLRTNEAIELFFLPKVNSHIYFWMVYFKSVLKYSILTMLLTSINIGESSVFSAV